MDEWMNKIHKYITKPLFGTWLIEWKKNPFGLKQTNKQTYLKKQKHNPDNFVINMSSLVDVKFGKTLFFIL